MRHGEAASVRTSAGHAGMALSLLTRCAERDIRERARLGLDLVADGLACAHRDPWQRR
jgi:hypothetical protein